MASNRSTLVAKVNGGILTIFPYPRRYYLLLFIFCIILVLFYVNRNVVDMVKDESRSRVVEYGEDISEILEREVRVFCWILTNPKNHKTKAIHVLRTWGKRCTRIVFVTSAPDDELETLILPMNDSYTYLWGRTRETFRYIWEHYRDEADWFMKADDDTYVFMENLRYMLYEYSPETPIYFGYKFKLISKTEGAYMSGGSGYTLSKEALRRFNEIALKDPTKCRINDDDQAEDIEMGLCLHNVDVIAGDSRDSSFKQRYLPYEPHPGLIAGYFQSDFWPFTYSFYHLRACRDCLSQYPIAFHYVEPDDMYMYEYTVYEAEVYGREDIVEELPKRLKTEEIVVLESDNIV